MSPTTEFAGPGAIQQGEVSIQAARLERQATCLEDPQQKIYLNFWTLVQGAVGALEDLGRDDLAHVGLLPRLVVERVGVEFLDRVLARSLVQVRLPVEVLCRASGVFRDEWVTCLGAQ